MNRQNIVWHLMLALMVVAAAAFVGQMRRWQTEQPPPFIETPRAGFPDRERAEPDAHREAKDILVRFRAGTSEERVEEITDSLNDEVDDRIESVAGLFEIDDRDDEDPREVAARYAAMPEVEYAEAVETIALDDPPAPSSIAGHLNDSGVGLPNDPMLGEQWALINKGQREGKDKADIGALTAWQRTQGSDSVVVAVLDSGVDYTHPDLSENIWTRPDSVAPYEDEHLGTVDDVRGFNAVENARDPMDENGHGTHCAGIVGAVGNNGEGIAGVNWKVEIMPLKFIGSGGFGNTKDAIEAINYVIDRKRAGVNVRVISASWGSTVRSRALQDVIRKAGDAGILFVAAAGNSSADTDRRPHYPSSYDLPNVVAVAAMNRRDELAGFSNYGAKSVHLAAPGAEILSTWLKGDYREASGTSMATPVVSGVAALVLSVDADLSVKELRERLLGSVDKVDALNGKVSSGGRVNAARAVGVD